MIAGKQKKMEIAIDPMRSQANPFVNNFSECLAASNFITSTFNWSRFKRVDYVIFHWPDAFFQRRGWMNDVKCWIKLAIMLCYKKIFGTRFIWVAHNAKPHEMSNEFRTLTQFFLRALDGIIYLSSASRSSINTSLGILNNKKSVTTVHGHYINNMHTPPAPQVADFAFVRLLNFGQIRPYKNIEKLVELVATIQDNDVCLTVAGSVRDEHLAKHIAHLASQAGNIVLDMRADLIDDSELEIYVDSAHAIVLPYRDILNSGSVLFALSRNRPVLAPRMGSLPEIQAQVGRDWLYLYDGDLNHEVLISFAAWLRHRDTSKLCDLSYFAWDRIGDDIRRFITEFDG